MGLFGGYVTTVGTAVSRVIEDKMLPNSVLTGLMKSIYSGDSNASNAAYIIDEVMHSIGMKANRMYDYGKNKYPYGLPSGQVTNASFGKEEVQAVLDSLEGSSVLIDYCRYGAPNLLHQAWKYISEHSGYVSSTNRILSLEDPVMRPEVYLYDIEIDVPKNYVQTINPMTVELWGLPATAGRTASREVLDGAMASTAAMSLIHESGVSVPTATIVYEWGLNTWNPPSGSSDGYFAMKYTKDKFTFPIPLVGQDKEYFHVKYSVNGENKYFMYEHGSGGYPTLDAVHPSSAITTGTYFPFTYFRYNKITENKDTSTEAYKAGKKMCDYLGMDFDTVCDAIDENPDIKDVEQAMLVMAVPADSRNPMELDYLWRFFDNWFSNSPGQFRSPQQLELLNLAGRDVLDMSRNSIVIQDKRFKLAITNDGIFKTTVFQSGVPGTVTLEFKTHEYFETIFNRATDDYEDKERVINYHVYTRQKTESVAEQILVADLKTMYYIWNEYAFTGDEDDDTLLIPIDCALTDSYSLTKREKLYSRSLHYVFNSRVKTKLKWYQSVFFQMLLFIVAAVISIFTGPETMAAYGAVATTATSMIAYILVTAAMNFFISMAVTEAYTMVASALGADVAAVIAIVLAVLGMVDILRSGSISGAPFAQDLLRASSGLVSATQRTLQEDFQDLLDGFNNYVEGMEETMQDLESYQDLLNASTRMNPYIIFGEKPDDFYNRTVHSGNIGVAGIAAITHYVDMALTLPKLNDTIGDLNNGTV